MYEEILFPYFNQKAKLTKGFYVESWGRPYLNAYCNEERGLIDNVTEVQFGDFTFESTQDHSKWAISIERLKAVVCFSDMNHMDS